MANLRVFPTYMEAVAAILPHWPFKGLLGHDEPERGVRGVVICKSPIVEEGFGWPEYGQVLGRIVTHVDKVADLEAYIRSVPRKTLIAHDRYTHWEEDGTRRSTFRSGVVSYHRAGEGIADVCLLPEGVSLNGLAPELWSWHWTSSHDRQCYGWHVDEHVKAIIEQLKEPPIQRPYTFGRMAKTAHDRLLDEDR